MVRRLFPDVAVFRQKPEVMATAWLVGVCEWPAMEAIRKHLEPGQCSLGTEVSVSHLAPIVEGSILTASATCLEVDGPFSKWSVEVWDEQEVVAVATAGFVVVEQDRFVRRRIRPKTAALSMVTRWHARMPSSATNWTSRWRRSTSITARPYSFRRREN